MSIVIRPHSQEYTAAVVRFNQRLISAGAEDWMQINPSPNSDWLPKRIGEALYNEIFLAVEDNEVRGAYVLKHQEFSFGGNHTRSVGYYHHPISEGVVDKAYAIVGTLMIRDALQREPVLYALGMDGYEKPLPRMLKLLGWNDYLVPFYFLVLHPFRFLRQMEAIRQRMPNRALLDLAAFSGAGWLGLKTVHTVRSLKGNVEDFSVNVVPVFDCWADDVWDRGKGYYSMAATRSSWILKKLYPPSQTHFVRLQVVRDGTILGWAIVAQRAPKPRFGSLRVCTVVDCFAAPKDALTVVQAAVRMLKDSNFDMIITNQSNAVWGRAFEHAGFLKGPSNFVFAVSPQLARLLSPFDEAKMQTHFTRGDGDGLPRSF